MIVDDDDALRGLASEFLAEVGYKVYEARSGEEAIGLFSDYSDEIGLVITDMGLPGMGGDELILRVREINPKIMSIAISGFGGEDMVRASEANLFIPKPFSREVLLKAVASYLPPNP